MVCSRADTKQPAPSFVATDNQGQAKALPFNCTLVLWLQGTYASGFAYSWASGRPYGTSGQPITTQMMEKWPDQPTPYPKTRTALLYSSSRHVVAWGCSALKVLNGMSLEEQARHQ